MHLDPGVKKQLGRKVFWLRVVVFFSFFFKFCSQLENCIFAKTFKVAISFTVKMLRRINDFEDTEYNIKSSSDIRD